MESIRVVSLIPSQGYAEVMTPVAEQRLRSFATLIKQEQDVAPSPEDMRELLKEADGRLTGWRVRIPDLALEGVERLKIIGHLAGSVKRAFPASVYDKGIVVTHAAPVIARSVGEMAIGLIIAGQRQMIEHDTAFKHLGTRGDDNLPYTTNRGLAGSRIGIIGASMTGRELIKLLVPLAMMSRSVSTILICPILPPAPWACKSWSYPNSYPPAMLFRSMHPLQSKRTT